MDAAGVWAVDKGNRSVIQNGEEVPVPLSEQKFSGNLRVRVSPETHRHLAICAKGTGRITQQVSDRALGGSLLRG
ncbi:MULTISPECIES: toxin-antitoxin system HicB family antitoxin [Micrococcaceae]|uniref:toxin-antitoxin system HicB family antitoxin n=1 Tax=Micrococcaceae TaxID=1268 RepID=UPI001AE4F8B8